jgi:hypothetical protein
MFTLLHLLMSAIAALVAALAAMIAPANVPEQAAAPQGVIYGISEPPEVHVPALNTGRGADGRLVRFAPFQSAPPSAPAATSRYMVVIQRCSAADADPQAMPEVETSIFSITPRG